MCINEIVENETHKTGLILESAELRTKSRRFRNWGAGLVLGGLALGLGGFVGAGALDSDGYNYVNPATDTERGFMTVAFLGCMTVATGFVLQGRSISTLLSANYLDANAHHSEQPLETVRMSQATSAQPAGLYELQPVIPPEDI